MTHRQKGQRGGFLGSEDSPEHSGDREGHEEPDAEVELGGLLQGAAAQVLQGAQVEAQQTQGPAEATKGDPATQALRSAIRADSIRSYR